MNTRLWRQDMHKHSFYNKLHTNPARNPESAHHQKQSIEEGLFMSYILLKIVFMAITSVLLLTTY